MNRGEFVRWLIKLSKVKSNEIVFFSGSSYLNVNAGGRIAIPTKYRDEIVSDEFKGKMVLTAHHKDKCLVLYPEAKYQDVKQQLKSMKNKAQANILKSFIIGHAESTEMDGQGRIMIPAPLRKRAGIEKEVVLVGQDEIFQIWDERNWDEHCDSLREQMIEQEISGNLDEETTSLDLY